MPTSYANIFMGKLEQEFLQNQDQQPLVWWRYIDDIFSIWTHGEPALQELLTRLNSHHDTIKFTATWSTEEVVFLDTRVYLKNQQIETDLYVKPTDTHQYLHMNSCHPRHCKTAIPFGQALRLRRICSEKENLHRRTEELKGYLTEDTPRNTSEQRLVEPWPLQGKSAYNCSNGRRPTESPW